MAGNMDRGSPHLHMFNVKTKISGLDFHPNNNPMDELIIYIYNISTDTHTHIYIYNIYIQWLFFPKFNWISTGFQENHRC